MRFLRWIQGRCLCFRKAWRARTQLDSDSLRRPLIGRTTPRGRLDHGSGPNCGKLIYHARSVEVRAQTPSTVPTWRRAARPRWRITRTSRRLRTKKSRPLCAGTSARPILIVEATRRQDTSNSAIADITLREAGFRLTRLYMPSCGANRLKASSNRSPPSAWSRFSGLSHFTWRIERASTLICRTQRPSSHVCETEPGERIQRFILNWRQPGMERQAPVHDAAVPG
jgi:hypothetical protein